MSEFDFDLFVIGGGSGGVRVARWSGGLGAKVAICENDRFGGTCVIRGCIPKKLMVLGSHLPDEIETMEHYGWSVEGAKFNWGALKEARDKEISRLSGLYEGMLDKNKVTRLQGKGVLEDAHTVEVDGKKYTAKNIVVAVGGAPTRPNIPGIEHALTSNEVFELSTQPKSVLIAGGGYIAVEFAGIFNGLGSDVSEIIRADKVLRGFDEDMRGYVQEEMIKKGVKFITGTTIETIEKGESEFKVQLSSGETRSFDMVMAAMGRHPVTKGLGLEEAGVKLGRKGEIVVDAKHRTNVEGIYAIGDCTDRVNLTPVATAEGTMLAENLFNGKEYEMTYENIPSAVFCQPPLASVGFTEEQATEKCGKIDVYESQFRALKFTLTDINERTYMKLIVDQKSQKVVGCHMVGGDSPEIMQSIGVAIKAGATKQDFDATIGIHPTSAEEFVTMRTKRG